MIPNIWQVSRPVPVLVPPPRPERVAIPAGLEQIRSALQAIPNDTDPLDYDNWRNVGFAIHHATEGSDEGLALFHEFSARSPKYDPEFIDNRFWPYAGVTSAEPITERSLFALAASHGWTDPTIADDFDVLDAPADEFEALPPVPDGEQMRFMPVPAHEFAVATQLRWIIKGVLPQAELAVMYGDSGSGKSFKALDMAAAVALGLEWRGCKVHQGSVVYIAAEGANGFRNRLRAYSHHHSVDLRDMPLHVIHAAPNLLEKTDALDVAKAILHGVGRPSLIIVDTLAQTMPGGNENAGEDMGRALAHCRGLHRATGALVLLVHHSGKDASKGARGWSGLRAAADVELEVLRAEDDRVLTVTKQKDGDDGAEFGFRLETVLVDFDADGDEVTSCVVQHCDAVDVKGKKKGDGADVALRLLEEMAGLASDFVPVADYIAALCETMSSPLPGRQDRRRGKAFASLDALVASGKAVVEGARVRPA